MRRRKFLQASSIATGYGLSAVGGAEAETAETGPTDTTSRVFRSVYRLPLPDTPEVMVPDDAQYLLVPVSAPRKSSNSERKYPPIDKYQLVTDNDKFTGSRMVGGASLTEIMMWHSTLGRPYSHRVGEGTIVFEIPTGLDTQRAVVEHGPKAGGAEQVHEVNERAVQSMRSTPSFSVEDVDMPDAVTRGNPATVSIEVRNGGSRDGVFRAIFGPESTSHKYPVTFPVRNGEQVTYDIGFVFPPPIPDLNVDEDADSIAYTLDWGPGSRENTITVNDD